MRFFNYKLYIINCKLSCKGQSFLEGFIVAVIVTVFLFAAIQVCIVVIDDMYANYAAFSATRKIIVSQRKEAADVASKTVSKFFVPYMVNSKSILTYKTTHWDETILGDKTTDHGVFLIKKYNVKIAYNTRIIFYKLFNLFVPIRQQSARARMVKAPDQEYYTKAYPGAKEFKIAK